MKLIGGILTLVGLGYILTGLAQMLLATAWTPERIVIFGVGVLVVASRVYRSAPAEDRIDEKTSG
jgi:hypothetical protein